METTQPTPCKLFKALFKDILYDDLQTVKEIIIREPDGFDMQYWYAYPGNAPVCGTVRCIGGTLDSIILTRKKDYVKGYKWPIYGEAATLNYYSRMNKETRWYDTEDGFPIAHGILRNLFYPSYDTPAWSLTNMYEINAEEACEMIDLFITKTHLFLESFEREQDCYTKLKQKYFPDFDETV